MAIGRERAPTLGADADPGSAKHASIEPATDAEIVAASLSDPEHFTQVFERHFAAIHRYLARRAGGDVAEDLAAEVFVVAFERRRAFRPEAGDVRPWLYGIATNLLRNERRAERRLLAALRRLGDHAAAGAGADPGGSTGRDSEEPIDRRRIAGALAGLDPDQRDALLLYAWEGLSYAEISASLGVPPGTVASRVSRARRRLRAELSDLHDLAGPVSRPVPSGTGPRKGNR